MTGVERDGDAPMGPPWPVEVLADLHAGALDDAVAARLWPRVRDDAAAREVLAALDATRADLSGLAALPPPRMPVDLAARLDAALAQEAGQAVRGLPGPRRPTTQEHQFAGPPPNAHPGPFASGPVPGPRFAPPGPGSGFPAGGPPPGTAPVVDLADARKRRNRALGWGAGVLVAAAAAIGIVVAVLPAGSTPGRSVAAPPPGISADQGAGSAPLALRSGGLNAGLVAQVSTRSDYGPFADPARLTACLAANGLPAAAKPIGAEQVTLDGRPGVLMVLPTGRLAQYRLLVVAPTCTTGSPDALADTVVGGSATIPTR